MFATGRGRPGHAVIGSGPSSAASDGRSAAPTVAGAPSDGIPAAAAPPTESFTGAESNSTDVGATGADSNGASRTQTDASDETPTAAYGTGTVPGTAVRTGGGADGPMISMVSGDGMATGDQPRSANSRKGVPSQIGSYRVVRQIGQGGMGAVYLVTPLQAEKPTPMALKVIRGGLAGEDAVIRFGRERRVLSQLVHPNIARLLDAGETEDGDPYFVMEYVDGQSIDEYCDSRRLSIAERLELFRAVCAAVHHAHQNLVVHRDIKPRNILVTADGVPKLLDFGIAKLISHTAPAGPDLPTAPEVRTMTPEYASPEQIRGLPVSTATDVYSLGVVLYELLCGRRPHHFTSRVLREVERVVCDTEAERPSEVVTRTDQPMRVDEDGTLHSAGPVIDPEVVSRARNDSPQRLRKRLTRDLDNIVLMALRKEPQRRYSSAEALAEDVKRHLEGHPVIAAPDTFSYRTFKFLTRHRVGVAASAVVAATLMVAAVAVTWQWRVAVEQRDRADRRFNEVRDLANFFLIDVHDKIHRLEGSTPVRELLVQVGLKYLDGLAAEVAGDPALMEEVATGYHRLGDVQGGIRANNLGDTQGALRSFQHAEEIRRAILAEKPDDPKAKQEVTASLMTVADMLRERGDERGALERYLEAVKLQEEVVAARPNDDDALGNLAKAIQSAGDILLKAGQHDEAAVLFERSMEIRRRLFAKHPKDEDLQRTMATGLMRIGRLAEYRARPDEAITAYRESLAYREALAGESTADTRYVRDLLTCRRTLGDTLRSVGSLDEAYRHHVDAVEASQRLVDADPNNARGARDLAISRESLGLTLRDMQRSQEALQEFLAAALLAEELLDRDPRNGVVRQVAASSHEHAANLLIKAAPPAPGVEPAPPSPAQIREGEGHLRRSLELWRLIEGGEAFDSADAHDGRPNVERVAARLGLHLLEAGQRAEAKALLEESQRESTSSSGDSVEPPMPDPELDELRVAVRRGLVELAAIPPGR